MFFSLLFPHQTGNRICWPFVVLSWFLLGQEGIWQGDFSFVQLADPQSLGQSFSALLLENRGFKPSITITKTFLNESWILAYTCIHVFYFPPWTLLILRLGMLHGDKSWEEALRLELSSAWIVMPMQSVRRKRRCWATSWVFQIWLSVC